jgi:hypothetical protein
VGEDAVAAGPALTEPAAAGSAGAAGPALTEPVAAGATPHATLN